MAKDLPLSLTLQPFGYQSLSMRLFSFAVVWISSKNPRSTRYR